MDKIKTVKIKEQDGSISEESYFISVDAKNVDMDNGKELQETIGTINIDADGNIAEQLKNLNDNVDDLNIDIKKKAYFFNTVADMKNANLKNGDYICTLGYYEVNDGGAAEYKIVNEESESEYQEELSNGIYATLIIKNNTINPIQMGAKGNGINDDSFIIRKALNLIKIKKGGTLNLLNDKIYLLKTIENNSFFSIRNNCKITGLSTLKIDDSVGDYKSVFFFENTLEDIDECIFENFTIDENSTNNIVTLNTGQSNKERVSFRFIANRTKKIKNCIFENVKIKDCIGVWQFEFEGLFDNLFINNCRIDYNSTNTLNYDRTSVYLCTNNATVTNNIFNGYDNSLTCIELHGHNIICSNNIIKDYYNGFYMVNDSYNPLDTINRFQNVSNNHIIATHRGVCLWLSQSNMESKVFDIYSNYIHIKNSDINDSVGIGMYDVIGNNSIIKDINIYNNTILSNQSNLNAFRFVSTTSNTANFSCLNIHDNLIKGLMEYPFRLASNTNNTFNVNNIILKNNSFNIDSEVNNTLYLILREGIKNILIENNYFIYGENPTNFLRCVGNEDSELIFKVINNTVNYNFNPLTLYNSSNIKILLNHKIDGTLQLTNNSSNNLLSLSTFNLKNGSVINDNKNTYKKIDDKWIVKYQGDTMPKHIPVFKSSLFTLLDDTNNLVTANKNGYIPDHIAGTNLIGEWVTGSNELYVYKCLTNNNISTPTSDNINFNYVGEHAKFDIII